MFNTSSDFSQFEVVTTTLGAVSIRNKVVNEIMHNPLGPWVEANELYISQSRLKERLLDQSLKDIPLVIFDVGLGAGANALAAIHCWEALKAVSWVRPLKLISYENNFALISFALESRQNFPHIQLYESHLREVLHQGSFSNDDHSFQWEIRPGDFLKAIDEETTRPELIFYDPYSPKSNPEMWTYQAFKKIYNLAKPSDSHGGTHLLTYSCSTPIRVALLTAGFYVGVGQSTGPKESTTEASTQMEDLAQPLAERWWQRWERSHLQTPIGWPPEKAHEIVDLMKTHPQFKKFSLK